jgi:hypothetical protein
MIDCDMILSNDTESTIGSDEDDFTKKKQRSSIDDDIEFDNDDLDETDPRNIWRKRRKYSDHRQMSSIMQTEVTTMEQNNSNNNNNNNQMKTTNDYKNLDKYPQSNCLYIRPHDHQVPTVIQGQHDDLMVMSSRLVTRKNKNKRCFFLFLVHILYLINFVNYQ